MISIEKQKESIDKKHRQGKCKKETKVRKYRKEKKHARNKSIDKESIDEEKNTYIFIHMFIYRYIY